MTTAIFDTPRPSRAETDQADVDLEYHSLMGVLGGDEPTHDRSFERTVLGPHPRPARSNHGEMTGEHRPRL